MNKKMVFVGCGSANLFAALYLLDNGYDPESITIMDSGSDPIKRTSMLKGFAGAGLKSDGKFVFSTQAPYPSPDHVSDLEKEEYYNVIQNIMKRHLTIPESGISNPVPDSVLNKAMCNMDSKWGLDTFSLRQSSVWHVGTDNELIMAISMYNMMVKVGVNFMLNCTVTDIDFDSQVITYTCKRVVNTLQYDNLQVGVGKVGVDFADVLTKKYNIAVDHGYANVGGRFETPCSDIIKKFADDIQYDFKFIQDYDNGQMEIRSFCTCNYSAYVIEEGINGVRTYNGHAYGKDHDKENGMTNFGVIARIKGIDAQKFHEAVLSKFGKGGCVIRGYRWDGKSTIEKVENQIYWDDLHKLYSSIDGDVGSRLVLNLKNFIDRMNEVFGIDENYSYYIPEIKMAMGVIATDRNYKLADGRYPTVSWAGDSCTGSVGIIPAAVTGMRGIEYLIHN